MATEKDPTTFTHLVVHLSNESCVCDKCGICVKVDCLATSRIQDDNGAEPTLHSLDAVSSAVDHPSIQNESV